MRTKFDKDPLYVEQNSYTIKDVNAYIVFDLDTWTSNALRNFSLKICLFDATSIVKNNDKGK